MYDRCVPIDQLKLVRAWRDSQYHPDDEFDVEKILNHRYDRDEATTYYQVKWKGYDKPTWEPDLNITDRDLIADYYKHLNSPAH